MSPNVSVQKPLLNVASMLRKRSVIAWARRNECVQVLENQETLRYGQPQLQYLQRLFPFMGKVTTGSRRHTDLLPVFFEFSKELAHQTKAGEISRETSIFISLLVLVSLEVVLAAQTRNKKVLVICYLNRVVEDVRSYFRWAMPKTCWHWHEALSLTSTPAHNYGFDYLEQQKILSLVGPLRCRGTLNDNF